MPALGCHRPAGKVPARLRNGLASISRRCQGGRAPGLPLGAVTSPASSWAAPVCPEASLCPQLTPRPRQRAARCPASPARQAAAGSSQTYSFPTAYASRRGDVMGRLHRGQPAGAALRLRPRLQRAAGDAPSRPASAGAQAHTANCCVPVSFAGRRNQAVTLHHLHTAPEARSGIDRPKGRDHGNKSSSRSGLGP